MQLAWGTATDRGRVRRSNEDAQLAEPPVFLVSDGMGGREAGDVASAIVVDEFRGRVGAETVQPDWVAGCISRAGTRIRRLSGGGATVVGAALVEHAGAPYWLAFNVGDSRLYRCADGVLQQISVDHSLVQELVDAGELAPELARTHPRRNVITRAVGVSAQVQPDCWLLPGLEGDRLLLCSDGVTGELTDEQLAALLAQHLDPQAAAGALVAAAVQAGGRDNATAVVIDVLAVTPARTGDRSTTAGSSAAARPDDEEPEHEQTRPRRSTRQQPSTPVPVRGNAQPGEQPAVWTGRRSGRPVSGSEGGR
jgi:protein phosphatase